MSIPRPKWLVVEGPSLFIRVSLPPFGSWTIGSGETCDIFVPDPSVADSQAILTADFSLALEATAPGIELDGRSLEPGEVLALDSSDESAKWVGIGNSKLSVLSRREPRQATLEAEAPPRPIAFDPQMVRAVELAEHAASADAPVLILGESGAGKDTLAIFIHALSPRRNRPPVHLGSAELEESGVDRAFERARGSTAILDEVGDLPERIQLQLAQAIDGGRLSGVRIIATTSTELEGSPIRKKLLYRLAEMTIRVPPLRERKTDIVPLAESLLLSLGTRLELSPAAEAVLQDHAWPGNVRELANVLRATALRTRDVIEPEHLGLGTGPTGPVEPPSSGSLREEMEALEKRRILAALEQYGTQTEAAKALAIPMRTFLNRLDALGIPRARKSKRDSE